ncbi:MAG: type II toxin-antitoxin system RelE/ParE family toxin [Candidatus Acididesulfobacter diazotrophicus]|uniref:Type II toxin-antitoxin system RelE/ParE family toxin n=1 Tax=Candidatus Acididesulfobacter diazotrophicus TaxID=2597226 RepID=A0A519BKW4_9DELT|nr:MAG: type II toxin-antitoxin system RelE/ParE family toxin [Candidatus Acididesulfobacter diazotrophicus]
MHRIIIFYKTLEGSCPVKEFLDSLDGKVAQKITWVLSLLEDLDNIPSLYFKKLAGTDGIWECRIKYGSNIYRIFCFMLKDSNVVLTHGFIKKTQRTPKNEIEKAEKYKNDFIERSQNE